MFDSKMNRQELINKIRNNRYSQAVTSDVEGIGANLKDLISKEAAERALGAEGSQRSAMKMDAYNQIRSGRDADALAAIAETMGEGIGPAPSARTLESLGPAGVVQAARDYSQQADLPNNSLRGLYRQANQLIADNPGTAIPVGLGAAGAGTIAGMTASGQALNALANYIAGGQQSQAERDNVLRS